MEEPKLMVELTFGFPVFVYEQEDGTFVDDRTGTVYKAEELRPWTGAGWKNDGERLFPNRSRG